MKPTIKLAVLGAGLIGRRHIDHIIAVPEGKLTAIVDPTPAARGRPHRPTDRNQLT
jgi:predicted dehydrogenase